MDDHLDEMIDINAAFHDKDLVRIILLKFGICDNAALNGIVDADDSVILEFLSEIMESSAFTKLLKYLRS